MLQSWMIFFLGLAYLGGLFAVATWGDRPANRRKPGSARPFIYALSLGVSAPPGPMSARRHRLALGL